MQGMIDNELINDKKKELSRLRYEIRDYKKRLKRLRTVEAKEPYYIKYLRAKVKAREVQQEIYFIKSFYNE